MQHPPQETQSEGHRNWIRCNLGLQEIGKAIRSHVDERFRGYHKICQYNKNGKHTHRENGCVKRSRKKWKLVTNPPCDTCHVQFVSVNKLLHRPDSKKISWTNVEFPIWEKGHWELAKPFMPRGNRCTNTPEEAETMALLQILHTCRLFCTRNYKRALVTSLIQKKDMLTYSSSHEITSDEAKEIFNMLTKVLEMLEALCPCEEQLTNLQMLQETQLTAELITRTYKATIQDLLKSIRDLNAFGEDASYRLQSLNSIIEHLMIHHEAEMETLKEEIRTGMARETLHENSVKEKEHMIEAKSTIITEMEIKIKRLQEVKERKVNKLTEEINKLKMRISELLKDIESKDDNSKELRENMKKMMAVNEEQNATIMSLNGSVKMLEETNTELQRSLKELEDTVTKLCTEKEKLKRTIDDLSARKKNEIKGLHEKIRQLNISNDERKKEKGNLSNILIVFGILTVIISVFFLRIGNFFYQE